jgi:asparagine synthase (glutamine-hydrolysing)
MCGIWGVVNISDRQMAEGVIQAMYHRGPDDSGIFTAETPLPVSLVNTRLAILDLSPGGHQPMSTPDGRYWIVYNGEVYNFEAIRQTLESRGHLFISTSDTEVILHAYQEWGEDCLQHLRGMFAFAVWDTAEASLFAARDRLGIKPFYYTQMQVQGNVRSAFIFGSELKALLATGLISPRINTLALHHYLSFYAVPTPLTMLEGIHALPPGHMLTFREDEIRIRPYWSLPAAEPLAMDERTTAIHLRELLEESIRLRMIADVPVGAFLSGGIDSSAVVALMTRASGERLKTFSIGFGGEGKAIDERSAARVLADRYGTDHTEVIATGSMVRDQIEDIIRAMDQPSGDGLNTYLVSQATARHVKVALSGLGGDELFAGYPQFRLFQQAARGQQVWNRLPRLARQGTRRIAEIAPPARRALTWLEGDTLTWYERVRVLFDREAKLELYSSEMREQLVDLQMSAAYLGTLLHPEETDPQAQLTRLELSNYMAHTLLRDTDAMSMAHSLEVRVPLIDHKLVEFAVRIPASMKLRHGRGKWILAEALSDVLPRETLSRPKRGFEMPVGAWMRSELHDVLDDVFSRRSVENRGWFDYQTASAVYRGFREGRRAYMYTWSLAVLELWARQTFDGGI